MARTPSNMLPLGTPAPYFSLPNTEGGITKKTDFSGKPIMVMFICNHCPFVKHIQKGLAELSRDYAQEKIGIVAINSNDVKNYPGDSPENMKIEKASAGYQFPYLFDETQEIARSYDAACTPDFYLFDADHRLVYRGQFDDSRPGNGIPVTGKDLRFAMDAVLKNQKIPTDQKPSLGCNIKWKE